MLKLHVLLFVFFIAACGKSGDESPSISSPPPETLPDTPVVKPVPPPVVINNPGSNPYSTTVSPITISGTCETGNTVTLSGANTGTTNCSSGSFSFLDIAQTNDGTYSYSITQTNSDGNSSSPVTLSWIKTTPQVGSPPAELQITNPLLLSTTTNTNLTITGLCEVGAHVYLSGDSQQDGVCVSGDFSFNISKSTSGTYYFNLYQTNANGSSGAITVSWVFDNIAPAKIVLTSPLSNPYTSGDSAITLMGNCENLASVNLAGASSATTSCHSGVFSFNNLSQADAGTYDYMLTQTDLAGNTSQPLNFSWIKDISVLPTPTITNFTDSPHYTKTTSLIVSGGCLNSHTVHIYDNGVSIGSTTCIAGAYSVTINKAVDDIYLLGVMQTDSTQSTDSPFKDFIWILDRVAPGAPIITSPTSSPVTSSGDLTIEGSCEDKSTVNLSGDSIKSAECVNGQFSFVINKAADATYNFSIS